MKKITFILIALITFSVSAQKKKKNGTIYIDHPGIDLVESFIRLGLRVILKKLDQCFLKISE